ncbi:anti-sigma factor [Isoptericola sp. BMS4]|uniref:anti-sigma factor n=1 Tax=Isoptericola sp. BMS4 TaxID=2527875 RepID=UPI0014203B97|nr:anti-sigma factor [Isoptericola sp. BMS4]
MPHIDDETLALHALGEDVLEPEQRVHLEGCPACARTAQELASVVTVARSREADPELVPPAPEVWERVRAEVAPTDVPATAGRRAPGDEVSVRRARRAWQPVAAAACIALVLGVVGGMLWERRAPEPGGTTVATAALDPLPDWQGSSGEAVVTEAADGQRQIVVSLDAPVPDGTYREVWLLTPDVSGLVSLGVLEGDEGSFDVPEGLDLGAYPVVDVSEEPLDGDPAHSGDSVVRGSLTA